MAVKHWGSQAKSQATILCWINIQVLNKAEFSSQICEAQILVSTVPKVHVHLVQSVVPLIIVWGSIQLLAYQCLVSLLVLSDTVPDLQLPFLKNIYPLYILKHTFYPVQVSQITSNIWNTIVYHLHRGCSAEFQLLLLYWIIFMHYSGILDMEELSQYINTGDRVYYYYCCCYYAFLQLLGLPIYSELCWCWEIPHRIQEKLQSFSAVAESDME